MGPAMITSLRRNDRAIATGIAVALLASWELSSRQGWISTVVFPPPTRILANFAVLWHHDLAQNVGITLVRFFGGILLGAVPGILLGLAIGWSERIARIVDPFIAAIHPVPKIVLFPLIIVIFGMSEFSKLIAVGLTVFFPMLINSAAGVRQISPLYFEVVRSYGGRRIDILRHVVLPGSLPLILTGIRIAANLGLLVTVAIEFTVASGGIGSIIWLSWQTLRIEDLYDGVVLLSVLGFTMSSLLHYLLRILVPWQQRG
jgi:ABC-type nitrate/sulfonate/bicarbonate transport system permease component